MTKKFSCAAFALLLLAPMSATAAQPETIKNFASSKMQWQTTEEGVSFAALIGDRFKESYMAMVRLPAGLVSPPHIKSSNMFGVVLKGTITHIAIGADASTEIQLPAGSFYKVPAGVAHISKCISQTECVSFLYQDGKFDFLPVVK